MPITADVTTADFTTSDGTRLHYVAAGSGPLVVLLHGLAGSSREFLPTLAALAPEYQAVAVDLRGHGQSMRRPGDLTREAFVADVVALIERLSPGRPVHLVGQSMGAHTAMLTAAAHPELVESLVLLECDAEGTAPASVATVAGYFDSWPVPFADRAAASAFLGDSALAAAWLDDLEDGPGGLWPRFDADIMAGCLQHLAESRCPEWESVQAPTLVVYGGNGMFTDKQRSDFATRRPGTVRVDVPLAGHDVHLENFPAWLKALREFLPSGHPTRPGDRRRADVTGVELVGGVEQRELLVVPYDIRWPERFELQRRIIDVALGGTDVTVTHIGSTSVPGLAAKAIIDVLVTVADITAEEDYLAPLLGAGYELRTREPGHRMVRTPERDVHVHILEHSDPRGADYLLLRDRLRTNAADRELYAKTKHALAAQDWPDMNAYADAKTDVIEAIKGRARQRG